MENRLVRGCLAVGAGGEGRVNASRGQGLTPALAGGCGGAQAARWGRRLRGRTLVIANAPAADAPRLFDLSRQRGLRVDLTIALTPPEGRPATAWTAADWAALRRANDTILAAAHG